MPALRPAHAYFLLSILLISVSSRAQYKGDDIPGFLGMQSGTQAPPGLYVGNVLWVYPTDTIKDDKGNTVEWAVEMMSLNHLKSYGWSRNTVQPGDVISCTGGAAKSGLPAMLSSLMKLADGREIRS